MSPAGKKIAILGGHGMLGTDIMGVFADAGLSCKVFDLPEFDITDQDSLKAVADSYDMIINCAAYTNVDGAEAQSELAYRINAEAVGRLGSLSARSDKCVIHISTDFVFDGESDVPYTEIDVPNPVNTYGKSKLEGEHLLLQNNPVACVIRVQWTYGLAGNNFVKKLLDRARSGQALKVVDDQIGSPTATVEVAMAIRDIVSMDTLPAGVFHFAAADYVSRYDMARFVFDTIDMEVNLSPCKSSDFVTPVQRPLSSRFNCQKIQAILPQPIKTWQKPLNHFLQLIK